MLTFVINPNVGDMSAQFSINEGLHSCCPSAWPMTKVGWLVSFPFPLHILCWGKTLQSLDSWSLLLYCRQAGIFDNMEWCLSGYVQCRIISASLMRLTSYGVPNRLPCLSPNKALDYLHYKYRISWISNEII